MTEGQAGLCTESKCEWCRTAFTPKNRNGLKVRFCKPKCSRDWHNAQRLKGAALLKDKSRSRKRGPSKHAQQVSRFVFVSMVPVEQRAELLRQAAQNLGITDEGEVLKALRRNSCLPVQSSAFSLQPAEATA